MLDFFLLFSTIFFETGSLSLELFHCLDCLAFEPLGSIYSLLRPSAGVIGIHHPTWLLCGCQGSKHGSSCLHNKHFTHRAISLATYKTFLSDKFYLLPLMWNFPYFQPRAAMRKTLHGRGDRRHIRLAFMEHICLSKDIIKLQRRKWHLINAVKNQNLGFFFNLSELPSQEK